MQDRPTASALVAAVADFITREISPTLTDQRLRFRSLIAANVLAIIERELENGDAMLRAEWQRLAALHAQHAPVPPANEAAMRAAVQALSRELCREIRRGEADASPRYEAVLAHAQATVSEKLQIANPRFLERVGA